MTTAELVLIVCVALVSAAAFGLVMRSRQGGVRRAYAVGWYVAFGGIGAAIALVGALTPTGYLTGGLVVTASALASYITRPKGEVS